MVPVPAPMLAVSGRPPDTAAWAIEMKWDGARGLVITDGRDCRLYSRSRRDFTASFPELAAALVEAARGRRLILDGEVLAQTTSGVPSFALLQRRLQVAQPRAELVASVPVQWYGFDVLAIDDRVVTGLPYLTRRELLEDLELGGGLVSVPPYWRGVAAERMLALAAEHHLEGIMSKEVEAAYHSGRRSPSWIKTPIRRTAEAIVAGWTPGTGMMSQTFGSLVLGAHTPEGRLVHIGNVGTGFTLAARRQLRARLDTIAESAPQVDLGPEGGLVSWVRPVLVGEVEYREFTGESLRHASWRGLRADKEPDAVSLPP
ncbi:non-homologous end-joining DNA ligase [Nocardia sp. NPDC048505]|uniref:non-homologous end-joining DNA ligase n=1 Tax=Nocardia sp. NPDC048505 TaxID=3155756 RepID=UPI0033EEFAD5